MLELSTSAKIALDILSVVGIVFIVFLIIRDRLKMELGLLWIVAFIVSLVVVSSTTVLTQLTNLVGGIYPTAGLSVLAFGFIFLLLIIFTTHLTILHGKIKNLSQYISSLEKRVREVEREDQD
ncbi:MAG: DUF2304 domain-containing protein [Nitrospira sp.]|nr:DUF2304 domain-containing protein [bacterium]MBL7050279.1 DUF2304 domain-containing protein [Nitrospira sp.]